MNPSIDPIVYQSTTVWFPSVLFAHKPNEFDISTIHPSQLPYQLIMQNGDTIPAEFPCRLWLGLWPPIRPMAPPADWIYSL